MSYTMEDFRRDYVQEHFPQQTLAERLEILQSISPEERWKALEALPPQRLKSGESPRRAETHIDEAVRRPEPAANGRADEPRRIRECTTMQQAAIFV